MTELRRLAPGRYRLQVADYEQLAEAGAFKGSRTELIEGEVIVVSPQYRPHGMVKLKLYDALRDHLLAAGSSLRPVVEFSLALADDSMPDPDIMLTGEPEGERAVPLASVALVIEVASTTLGDDLGIKQRLYATAGIPEYWVADVTGRVVHQMWAPVGITYGERRAIAFGERLESPTITGLGIGTERL